MKPILAIKKIINNLNREDRMMLWDVMELVRGPDNPSDPVKSNTCNKVRAVLGIFPPESLKIEPKYTFADVAKACGYHFASHVQTAEHALKQLGSDVPLLKKDA